MNCRAGRIVAAGAAALAAMILAGCSSSTTAPSTQTLFDKYGGAPTIKKVVDDAVTGVLADPTEAPFFAAIGTAGHDSADKLKSCLRLQFTAVFGGPATYPGVDDLGDTCHDMASVHSNVGVTSPVFDRFVTDLTGVLATDGVSQTDIAIVAPTIVGLKSQIVTR